MDAGQVWAAGRREKGGCDTQAEWWFVKVGVVIYPGRFFGCVWCLLGLFAFSKCRWRTEIESERERKEK